ncbi:hypothetical protein [Dyella agri]|uniref:DUF2357 domain-containing protein n=1 Tax=Dyella agri TaxID=1926869 RepID=A0ABW8KCA1_9GAMM
MNELIDPILSLELETVRTLHKLEPYTKDFIFGNDHRLARIRNQQVFKHPTGPLTLLSTMLRFGLDEEKRSKLFTSAFDLGSLKAISQDKLSLTYLAKKVRKEKNQLDDVATRKKEFQSITAAIKKITGRRIGDYRDKQNAIRVVYLIDKLMTHPRYAKDGRAERFLTFIKTPRDKFSFETRVAYPTADGETNSFLLNDLRCYLGIDIERDTLVRIDSLFYTLIERVNEARGRLDALAFHAENPNDIARNFRQFIDQVDSIDLSQFKDPQRTRLDQDLYVHLQKLEFMHFAGSLCEIYQLAAPPSPITPIRDHMVLALNQITDGRRTPRDVCRDNFWLEAFDHITSTCKEVFVDLIHRSLGWVPSESEYERSIALAGELLFRVKFFGSDVPVPRDEVRVSFRDITSSLCTVAQALRHRTIYRPSIFRSTKQTRSIITPLEQPLDITDLHPDKVLPEGYVQLWHHRREWVLAALDGAPDLAAQRFALRATIFEKAMFCMTFNDIEIIEAAFQTLEAHLSDVRPNLAALR